MVRRAAPRERRWSIAGLGAALAVAAALGASPSPSILASAAPAAPAAPAPAPQVPSGQIRAGQGSPPAPPAGAARDQGPPTPTADRGTRLAQAGTPERRDPPPIDEPKADTERQRPQVPFVVPQSGPGPVVAIPLADALPGGRLAPGELPPAWALKRFSGRAQFELTRDDGRQAFRLVSQASSFALHRDVSIDLQQFPVLTWSWKVVRLPRGDERDQAAQVYVIFPRAPNPRASSDVVGYIWDSQSPVGHRAMNPDWPNVRVVVLESGAERAGKWVREQRDVRRDYVALFGKEPPAVGRVAVMTDSDHTRTTSEAFFSDLAFQRAQAVAPPEPSRRN